jgi:hypothetical protein
VCHDNCVEKAELVIKSKPEDDFLDAACSVCHSVKFHLTGNTLERKQVLRQMFDNHVRTSHTPKSNG